MCHTLVHVTQSLLLSNCSTLPNIWGCLPYASQTDKAMHAYWPYTCRAAHATLHYIKPAHYTFWITCWNHCKAYTYVCVCEMKMVSNNFVYRSVGIITVIGATQWYKLSLFIYLVGLFIVLHCFATGCRSSHC